MEKDTKTLIGMLPQGKCFAVAADIGLFLAATSLVAYGGSKLIKPLTRSAGKDREGIRLEDSGFSYDPKQDIFYSIKKPWQKKFGYCRLYEEIAPLMNCIFECEPICFEYEGKKWLIEFWKGQYGMTTGCEIGVYTKDSDSHSMIYKAVGPEDNLLMSATLVKNGDVLFEREDRHWWLTGFVLGEYSEPEELTMHACIRLKTQDMCKAFVRELERIGYQDHRILYDGKTVCFVFSKPYSGQPKTHSGIVRAWVMKANKTYCDLYQASGIDVGEHLRNSSVLPSGMLPYNGLPHSGFGNLSGTLSSAE